MGRFYAGHLYTAGLLGLESRAYAQLGENETGNADRSAQTCVAVYDEAPPHERAPDWIHYMNQAEVDCLAANTYIELALHVGDRSQMAALRHQGRSSLPARPPEQRRRLRPQQHL